MDSPLSATPTVKSADTAPCPPPNGEYVPTLQWSTHRLASATPSPRAPRVPMTLARSAPVSRDRIKSRVAANSASAASTSLPSVRRRANRVQVMWSLRRRTFLTLTLHRRHRNAVGVPREQVGYRLQSVRFWLLFAFSQHCSVYFVPSRHDCPAPGPTLLQRLSNRVHHARRRRLGVRDVSSVCPRNISSAHGRLCLPPVSPRYIFSRGSAPMRIVPSRDVCAHRHRQPASVHSLPFLRPGVALSKHFRPQLQLSYGPRSGGGQLRVCARARCWAQRLRSLRRS